MGIIYILENKINGKCYVGQTIQDFNRRIKNHKSSRTLIGNALRKYGIDNFIKTLIEVPAEELNELEIKYIKEHNSISPNGYNLTYGGDKPPSHKGLKRSEETKKKLSETKLGEKNPMFGKHPSEEHRRKMSEMKGDKNPFFGKHHTEEARIKMSNSHKGVPLSKEHREHLGEANRRRCAFKKLLK